MIYIRPIFICFCRLWWRSINLQAFIVYNTNAFGLIACELSSSAKQENSLLLFFACIYHFYWFFFSCFHIFHYFQCENYYFSLAWLYGISLLQDDNEQNYKEERKTKMWKKRMENGNVIWNEQSVIWIMALNAFFCVVILIQNSF